MWNYILKVKLFAQRFSEHKKQKFKINHQDLNLLIIRGNKKCELTSQEHIPLSSS